VRQLGEHLRHAVAELPGVGEVRGRGLMIAFELVDGGAPDFVMRALAEERIVLNATGPTTVRLLPPLIIDRAQADDALQRLGRLLGA
jgi:acetylornithine/succinyldiaminopimelate/putrescine aminotransferase